MSKLLDKLRGQLGVTQGRIRMALQGDSEAIDYATIRKLAAETAGSELTVIGPGIRFKKVVALGDTEFYQQMEPNACYNKHHHPDADEIILVTSGEIIDLVSGRTARAGDTLTLRANVPHAPMAGPEGSTFIVFIHPTNIMAKTKQQLAERTPWSAGITADNAIYRTLCKTVARHRRDDGGHDTPDLPKGVEIRLLQCNLDKDGDSLFYIRYPEETEGREYHVPNRDVEHVEGDVGELTAEIYRA